MRQKVALCFTPLCGLYRLANMEEIILQLTELNAKNGSSTRLLLVLLRTLPEKSLHAHTSTFWKEHCIAFKNLIKILIYILITFFQTQL